MEINNPGNKVIRKKRKRSVNWDSCEKDLLRFCMKGFLAIVENKNTDTNTNKAKRSAWIKITQKFNQINSRKRALPELKLQWKATKLADKKRMLIKKERGETGSGEKPASPNPVKIEVIEMTPEFEVDESTFDSDGPTTSTDKPTEDEIGNEYIATCPKEDQIGKNLLETVHNKTQSPPSFRNRMSPFLRNDLTMNKDELLIKNIREQHELKMRHAAEVHELKIKYAIEAQEWARLEHEQRMREAQLRTKETEMRIKNLELEHKILNKKEF